MDTDTHILYAYCAVHPIFKQCVAFADVGTNSIDDIPLLKLVRAWVRICVCGPSASSQI